MPAEPYSWKKLLNVSKSVLVDEAKRSMVGYMEMEQISLNTLWLSI